jgi:WD40 repeat protein
MALAFSPDGKWLASGCRGSLSKSIHLFTVADDTQVYEFMRHTRGIQGLAFSADSKRLITASLDNTARLLDAPTGVELVKLDAGSPVRSAIMSADGKWLALGTAEGVRLYGPPPGSTPPSSPPQTK